MCGAPRHAGIAWPASEGVIGQAELKNRPLLRPGDVLEAIPGLIMTQHSGSGKANQMFLRGFNLDHGTDFATWVDGMPVNMRTHGHGQGYTDVNFLIPELIRTIDYVKGPYHAEVGDFSSAGAALIRTYDELPENRLVLGGGQNGYVRGLLAASGEPAGSRLLGALEAQRYDGPWTDIDENLSKVNGLLRWSAGDDRFDYGAMLMYYDASWNSADQIPARAVQQGMIDPYGSLDTTVGGDSRRMSGSAWADWGSEDAWSRLGAYVIDYDMQLWSDFTYWLDDPERGDQFEQLDRRTIYGMTLESSLVKRTRLGHLHQRFGAEFRYDDIHEVGLFHTQARERLSTVRLDRVGETSLGAYYELEWRFDQRWRSVVGIRSDYYWFDVTAQRPENSGRKSSGILSPKLSLAYSFGNGAEAYVTGGLGFHSNDARGTTISVDPVTGEAAHPVDPLVRSRGAEVGVRMQPRQGWNSSLALWYLELDSELLYVGDAGNTEASRPSHRSGVEFNNYWRLNDIWTVEADFAWTRARFSEPAPEGDRIPGAIEAVVTSAVTAELPNGLFTSLRLRWFGRAPLIEDGSASSDGSAMVNLSTGWTNNRWRLQLDVLNLLDSTDHDIDYFYASRLPGEPAAGVEDIHYHIFEPRQFRAYLSWLF
ncbi:MAG: TonB-dependent receptor [Lysobacterales bacterium]